MQLLLLSALALAVIAPVQAFTNGSLVPAYFCSPHPDGLPKSLGQLIPFTVKDQNADLAFNANASQNLATVPVTGKMPGNAGYILASFHNSNNKIAAIIEVIQVTTLKGGPLVAGEATPLLLNSGDPAVALDGAMLYGKNAEGERVGSFHDAGGVFVKFPGCGRNEEGHFAGVIHEKLVSDNATYSGLSYIAPKCGNGEVTLAGLGVTDNGFGVWNYTLKVTGQHPCREYESCEPHHEKYDDDR